MKKLIDKLDVLNNSFFLEGKDIRTIGLEPLHERPALTYVRDSKVVTDSGYSSAYPYNDQFLSTVIQDNRRKSYQYLSSLIQNGISSSIVDTLSSEATKSNIEIICDETNAKDHTEIIDQIKKRFYQLDIYTVMREALRANYVFGGSSIFFEIGGNHAGDFLDLEFSLSPLTVSENKKLTRLTVVDPIFCVPIEINTTNPLSADFYLPSMYSVMGQSVHASRMYRMVTNEVPDNIKPMYNFFGISLLQQCEEYIYRFEIVTENINAIIKRMRTSVFATSMTDLLTGNCSEQELLQAKNSLNVRNSMLHKGNNNSMILLDKEMEDFREINTNLSGLSDLLSSISEQLCLVPKIPATKLLGISPKGMNATGESDMNNFYDEISKIQNNYLVPFLNKVLDILYMEITGKKNLSLQMGFEPINQQALLESQVEASFINDSLRCVELGVISVDEMRARLGGLGWDLNTDDTRLEEMLNDYQA